MSSNAPSLNNEELHNIIKRLLHVSNVLNQSDRTDQIYGSSYYDDLQDVGVTDYNRSIGNPKNNSINRYYDEKRNYSILAPTLDPTNIHNLSKRVKQSIQENDFSESTFFSSTYDRDEITERFLEKSLIYSKRLEWYRIKDLKSRPKFDQLLGINLMILDKLDNMFRYLVKDYILQKEESQPKGKNFYVKPTFLNGASTTRIDFTDMDQCKNLPDSFMPRNFPNTELFSLVIKVDTGGPVFIGINEPENDLSAYVELKVNEEHKIENTRAVIKSVNIRAVGADSVVRVLGMF